jgi:hypothetical protein
MSNVIPFTPRHELDAKRNMREFINHCRTRLDLYGADLAWDDNEWDVTERHRPKGSFSKRLNLIFGALGSNRYRKVPMHEDYVDFAKAYLRHELTFSGDKNFTYRLSALRVLEQALIRCSRDGVPRVHLVDERVAKCAIEVIWEHFQTTGSRYCQGQALQTLLAFLLDKNLAATPFPWKNPLPPPEMGTLLGEEHDERRASKLPSREVLAALGTIFDRATEPRDIIVTSCIALLCSAPSRISETVTMQNHCEVWLDNGDGSKDLTLRWYPAKSGQKGVKPVPKVMEPIALRAIERMRAISEEPRAMARWYEDHPDKLYLPPGLEYLRQKELLDNEEFTRLFGYACSVGAQKMAVQYGIAIHKTTVWLPNKLRKDGTRSKSRKEISLFPFANVERAILNMLPVGFPWADKENGVKFSDALFVAKKGVLKLAASGMPCMFTAIPLDNVLNQLRAKCGTKDGKNIFARHGFINADGSPMEIKSHQARHWLNTISERGGLSDLERDMWSGRRTSAPRSGLPGPTNRQSLTYLHNTTEEMMTAAGLEITAMDQGSMEAAVEVLPVTREEFLALENRPTMHVTEFGVCIHDFAIQPCQTHADCLNCTEHACLKGDREKAERIRQCHTLTLGQIAQARQVVEEGYLKAERWYQHQALTARRLSGLLEILDDASLPDDAVIMLVNPFQYSAFRNAVEGRAALMGDGDSLALAAALLVPPLPLLEDFGSQSPGGQP